MHKSRILSVVLVVLVGGGLAAAATIVEVGPPVALGTLADGPALQVGDKLFHDFSWDSSGDSGPEGLPGAGIVVTPVVVEGDYGLRFNAGWTAGPNQVVQTTIRFRVRALDELRFVHDALLAMTAFGTFGSGVAAVREDIYPVTAQGAVGATPVASLHVRQDAAVSANMDAAVFPTWKEVYVVKEITVQGGGAADGSATISEVVQVFSQIPEPGTLGLLGLGALGLIRRRRQALRASPAGPREPPSSEPAARADEPHAAEAKLGAPLPWRPGRVIML